MALSTFREMWRKDFGAKRERFNDVSFLNTACHKRCFALQFLLDENFFTKNCNTLAL